MEERERREKEVRLHTKVSALQVGLIEIIVLHICSSVR